MFSLLFIFQIGWIHAAMSSGDDEGDSSVGGHKRARKCGMDSSAVDFMREIMEDSNRKNSTVSELRERVVALEFEKRVVTLEFEKKIAELDRQLLSKV